MSAEPALPIEIETTSDAPLSAKYRTDPQYRADADWRPQWSKVANPAGRAVMCHECAQLQHETRGRFGPRMQPRKRRAFPAKSEPDPARPGAMIRITGPTLLLCSRHAFAWEALDKAALE
ncbi:hypothetical protein [Nocardia brasiliensis]|uniref:hypothetical protein n=1 Tax=Nocardia brasiliensis TaxID=37326 RepID=UPI00245656AB|nr:hypothetical protein [Nocardia brasiliensis]